MASDQTKRLSADDAKAKAAECRGMAMRASRRDHQIMLHHMAETWERIAADVSNNEQTS